MQKDVQAMLGDQSDKLQAVIQSDVQSLKDELNSLKTMLHELFKGTVKNEN